MSEHQPTPATIWKFQIVRCAKRSLPKPEASSIRVAEYQIELPPQEVPGQNLRDSGGDAQRAVRCMDSGERKECVKVTWQMTGKGE